MTAVKLVVAPTGDAIYAWTLYDGSNWRVQARVRSPAGALTTVRNLASASKGATAPDVAIDAEGNAVFAWIRSDAAGRRLEARARSHSGAFTAVETIAAFAAEETVFTAPARRRRGRRHLGVHVDAMSTGKRLPRPRARALCRRHARSGHQRLRTRALDPTRDDTDRAGNVAFLWMDIGDARNRVMTRSRSPIGALSPIRTVAADLCRALDGSLHVAIDEGGNTIFVWREGSIRPGPLKARTRSSAGVWTAVDVLCDFASMFSGQALTVDRDGNALVVYVDNTSGDLVARAGP